jgi:hypothetical protein
LTKGDEMIVDETILDIIDLDDVLHNGLTLILYKVLDKSISAYGNPKSNVAVNLKRCWREQGTEVHEGGICNEQSMCGSVRISRRDTLYENLGLVPFLFLKEQIKGIIILRVRPTSSLRICLMSESTSSDTDSLVLM